MVPAGTSNDEIMAARGVRPGLGRGRTERLMTRHTLSVLVENKPGVLARVAGLFSRRGFNIESLAVGPTEHPEISRMTIVVEVEDLPLEQVTKQLNKLVNVLKIVELDPAPVRAAGAAAGQGPRRPDGPQLGARDRRSCSGPRWSTSSPESVTIEATGTADKLEALTDGAGAVRDPGDGAVRHGRGRPRAALDHRHRAALPRPLRLTRRRSRIAHCTTVQRGHRWQPGCTTTTTPTWRWSRTARWRCSATAARGTRTRSRCATPGWTSGSAWPRAPAAGRRPRPRGCGCCRPPRPARRPT